MGFLKIQFIGKYQKIEGTLRRHLKIFKKKRKMRYFNSPIVPKKVKGGPLGFFNIHPVAKYQKNEGGTLWRH